MGYLTFYVDSVQVSQVVVDNNISKLFHRYSLVRVVDGVLFKEYGGPILHFKTVDHSFKKSDVECGLGVLECMRLELI